MINFKKNIKDISLDPETINLLEIQAELNGTPLVDFIEHVLQEKAQEIELSDQYMKMMDDLLEKHLKGENSYLSEEEFFRKIKK